MNNKRSRSIHRMQPIPMVVPERIRHALGRSHGANFSLALGSPGKREGNSKLKRRNTPPSDYHGILLLRKQQKREIGERLEATSAFACGGPGHGAATFSFHQINAGDPSLPNTIHSGAFLNPLNTTSS